MTSLEQRQAAALELWNANTHLALPDLLNLITKATYNARTQEVVSIAEGMKQISVVVPHHNPYLSGYNQALNELITALT